MAWFAAHELFTPLHHICAHAEALLAGAHGPLPLGAVEPVAGIAAAARRLETALRLLAEIETLRRRPRPRAPARSVALRAILSPSVSAQAADALAVLSTSPDLAARALAVLRAGVEHHDIVKLHVGRRRVGIELRDQAVGPDAASGGMIRRELALLQLAVGGARVRRGRGRLLILWRRAPDVGGEATSACGRGAANRFRT